MVIEKVRAAVSVDNLSEVYKRPDKVIGFNKEDKKNLEYFVRKSEELSAKPKIFTQYKRLAYFSLFDEYVRLTFDRDLKFCKSDQFNVCPGDYSLSNYDHKGFFKGMPSDSVVLEIKTLASVPKWVFEFIQYFGLERGSFSKFESSLIESSGVEELDLMRLGSYL